MPRGYELNKYYDALRAVNRKIFSREIRILSGVLDRIGFRSADSYSLIISSLNKGLYENLGSLYQNTHFGNNSQNYVGLNKSSYEQDFMSPMELRMCAISARRAAKLIASLKAPFYLRDIQNLCYSAGEETASEFIFLKQGKNEFNMRIQEPVLSTKPIIKKYDHSLIMGTLPKSERFLYKDQLMKQQKKELILKNNYAFMEVKKRLVELGISSQSLRQTAYARFNSGFYEMDAGNTHTLEITKIILTDKAEDYVSIEELKFNIDKLNIMKNTLDRVDQGFPFNNIFKILEKAGSNARYLLISKYGTLPELYSGFYHTYIDADKKIANNKLMKQASKGDVQKW